MKEPRIRRRAALGVLALLSLPAASLGTAVPAHASGCVGSTAPLSVE